jgi:hypothetical protein
VDGIYGNGNGSAFRVRGCVWLALLNVVCDV